ncbi:MAG: sigma 54-interacting transcriptional regulator [bacterium]
MFYEVKMGNLFYLTPLRAKKIQLFIELAPMESETEKLDTLLELAAILGQQKDFQETLRLVTQKATSLLHAESAVVMMINPQTRQTVKTLFKRDQKTQDIAQRRIQTHVSGWIIENKQPFLSANIQSDTRFAKRLFSDVSKLAVLGVPLWIEGVLIGVLILAKNNFGDAAPENDLLFLEKLAAVVAPFLRNVQKIQQYFEPPVRADVLLKKYADIGLLGRSEKFIELLKAIEAATRCDVRVVLEGESGTGKELIARAIHRFSSRHDRPFVAVDCGAIAEHLLESELFGHKKGAFTGATRDRKGLLQEAEGGTLFIDEIADLPLEMQTKFMRFLQEGEVRPVGANIPQKVDVRIVSASSQSLHRLTEEGKFREDLFFRLHVYPISVPSLHERDRDIALLANHFLAKFSKQQDKMVKSFHPDTMQFMRQRAWKGNIRELENFVERLVTLASSQTTALEYDILPADLKDEYNRFALHQEAQLVNKSLEERLQVCEEMILRQALIESKWNQSAAARALRISEQILRYKMKKLGVSRPK